MQPAYPLPTDSDSDTATDAQTPLPGARPPRRLRWVMHGALLTIAVLLAAAGTLAWHGEQRRVADAELINLAGAQRMLSQRIALLSSAPVNVQSLPVVLERARREAKRIETLLTLSGDLDSVAEGETSPLSIALGRWQASREPLWCRAERLVAVTAPACDGPPLQVAAEDTLAASEALVAAVQDRAERKSRQALHGLGVSVALGSLLLAFLAFGVVEPTVRHIGHQHRRLTRQTSQLQRLALVAQRTHNVVVITDAQRRIVWVNEAFVRLTGYTLVEALGCNPGALLGSAQTDPAAVTAMRDALDQGEGVRTEILNRSKFGEEYWVDLDIQPLRDEAGALTGYIGVQTDITMQVQSRERLRALLDALPTGVVEQDGSGRICDANPAAEQILGLTRDQLLGRASVDPRWRTVRDDLSDYPGTDSPASRSLRDGVSVRDETVGLMTPQGDRRWLHVNSEPLRSGTGEITGAVACFLDVTAQRAQATLLRLALQAACIGTWDWTVAAGPPRWSDTGGDLLGYGTTTPPQWAEVLHPDDRVRVECALQDHLDHPGIPCRYDVRMRQHHGAWIWAQLYGAAVERDKAGRASRLVGVLIDISDRKDREDRLQASVHTDALTGLPNRLAVLDRLQRVIELRKSRPTSNFAVLFLDFDRFKQVNDTLGHAAGDELLRQIAQRLQTTLRPGDALGRVPRRRAAALEPQIAARLGGDEFVVVLERLHQTSDAGLVADRLLQALAEPYDVGGQPVHSTASIGLVTSDQPYDSAESLLRDADSAMYAAKRAGRGRWVAFASGSGPVAVHSADLSAAS